MQALARQHTAFERRTHLTPHEHRRDFTQLDNDTLDLLASDEACAVTPSMMKIYVRLHRALRQYQEREGVLYISGRRDEEGNICTAWQQLISIVGVANSTAKKALDWMTSTGVLCYAGYKNGHGIRIFFNRAKNSIGKRPENSAPQKNLSAPPVPSVNARIPSVVMPFNGLCLENSLDMNLTPKSGQIDKPP